MVKISAWRPRPEAKLSVRAHWEIERHLERHLEASGLNWSTLRPTGHMRNFFTGEGGFAHDQAVAGPYGTGAVAYIDTADVAACAAALLTGPGEAYPLTGPVALTHAEIAGKLAVPFRDQSPGEAAESLRKSGLPDWFVDDLLWLYADMASGAMSGVTSAVQELTGRPPRAFDDFLAARRGRER
ncbi:hypothetical protein [Streptomyces sp. NPDC020141]|uniref:hypothetical protein n=1 Tax=Streptomyces sp. NPDC020141 TaxID=3365065 RepID=UPI0037B0D750